MGLVTLSQAKAHLKPPGDFDDSRIEDLIRDASEIVCDYLKVTSDYFQSTVGNPNQDVPGAVRAATLLVLGALYDNADGQDPDKEPLSPAVKALLHSRRTPTLA